MSHYQNLLHRYAASHEPSAIERERVLRRVAASLARPAALDHAPVPARGAESRILARLGARKARHIRSWRPAGGLLAAAASLFLLKTMPAPLFDLDLSGSSRVRLSPEVQLDVDGTGRVTGTRFQPVLAWQIGRLQVEVEPQRSVELSVETREARVEVVGTGFTVTRDVRGTVVAVTHGRVRVTCAGGTPTLLEAPEQVECRPASAAGLLARAQADRAGDGAPTTILLDVRAGLATAGPAAVHQELRALLVQLLMDTGNRAEALAVATEYLERGGPRADEIQALMTEMRPAGLP